MNFSRLLLVILLGVMGSGDFLRANDPENKDPIDVIVDKMIDKDPSTAGMVQATDKGTEMWDAEMNKAYNSLMQKLPEAERETLKKSQLAWLAYRDANIKLVAAVYGHAQGTMYIPMAADESLELVKARTLLLRKYLDLLGENDSSK
jgi:uncharacterized protein YecT (DUF1311 family)